MEWKLRHFFFQYMMKQYFLLKIGASKSKEVQIS